MCFYPMEKKVLKSVEEFKRVTTSDGGELIWLEMTNVSTSEHVVFLDVRDAFDLRTLEMEVILHFLITFIGYYSLDNIHGILFIG